MINQLLWLVNADSVLDKPKIPMGLDVSYFITLARSRLFLATVAYDFGGGKPIYALEGSIAFAGSGVKFLMNNLAFIKHSSKITELAESVPDNGGVFLVAPFTGLFAPYWIDDAKGTLCRSGRPYCLGLTYTF